MTVSKQEVLTFLNFVAFLPSLFAFPPHLKTSNLRGSSETQNDKCLFCKSTRAFEMSASVSPLLIHKNGNLTLYE